MALLQECGGTPEMIDWKEVAYWSFGYGVGLLTGMTYLFIALRNEQEINRYLLAERDAVIIDPNLRVIHGDIQGPIVSPVVYQELADETIDRGHVFDE